MEDKGGAGLSLSLSFALSYKHTHIHAHAHAHAQALTLSLSLSCFSFPAPNKQAPLSHGVLFPLFFFLFLPNSLGSLLFNFLLFDLTYSELSLLLHPFTPFLLFPFMFPICFLSFAGFFLLCAFCN